MSMNQIPSTQAWTSGCEMWVSPTPDASLWARKLDWYLNFKISRGIHHQSATRPLPLAGILQKIRWSWPEQPQILEKQGSKGDLPLMIAAGPRLPCSWLLVLEDFSNLPECLKTLSRVWSQLNQPRLRVFAPSQFQLNEWESAWSKTPQLPTDFELVIE